MLRAEGEVDAGRREAAPVAEMIPVSFDGHAGAIHRPLGDARCGVTVVICAAVGREARCAYRPLFLWAEALAARGFQVLRYDHRGEGDSLDLDPAADQWRYWLDGVAQAADFARAYTGARQLVLTGLRIGAALALSAAEAVRPDGVMLLAPIPTGEAWLRDLRLAAAIQNAPPTSDDSIEVDGLRLSAATVRQLQAVDVASIAPSWRSAFVATTAAGRGMASALGPAVTSTPFEGYGKLFKEPHVNAAPARVFDLAATWLEGFAAEVGPPLPAPEPPPAQLETDDWLERPVTFGDGLRGVLCAPKRATNTQAVIFGNTAGDPRAGVGGFATRACRALAAAGVAALRFDFRGIGESHAGGDGRTHVYETERLGEFRSAATLMNQHGCGDIVLAGVCTGGFHAVRAVLQDETFGRAVAINSWLVWRPGRQLELRSETAQGRLKAQPAPRPTSRWARLISGDLDLGGALLRRLRQAWSAWRPDRPCRDVRRDMRNASSRGARIHILLGRGDPSMQGLEADFGFDCAWLARLPGVSVSILPGLEHALFSVESQEKAVRGLFDILGLGTAEPPQQLTLRPQVPRRPRLPRALPR